ncbi:MAG: iron uptake porin [Nodosilinea sp.]
MSNLWSKYGLAVPTALVAAVTLTGAALAVESVSAAPAVNDELLPPAASAQVPVQLAQITSVSDLTDVLPSDWAFQALQSLVENYGCIEGYPDRTFRGQRSLTRFEFAAGLNSCLDVIAVLISQSGINPDDLATIRRLQEEFQAELATLRGRVDALEAETAELRAQQFSTTTKLQGEADFHIGFPFDQLDVFDANDNPVAVESSTSVAARARLHLDSSFTGEDRLRISLEGGDGSFRNPFGGLANGGGSGYDVTIDDFYYTFPIGNRIDVTVAARGLQGDDWVTSTIVPFDGPSVADAGGPQFYDVGGSSDDGAGVGFNFALTDNIVLDAGYTASNSGGAIDPSIGIFSASDQSYIAQLSYLSDGFFNAGFAYLHNDQSEVFTGGVPGATDTFAGLLSFNFGNFFVGGHGAYQTFNGGTDFSWTAGLGFNDFLFEGAQLGVYGGQLPQTNFEGALGQAVERSNNPFLIEGYYEIPFNEFVTITPAIIYGDANLSNPGGTRTEDTTFYGAIRATFRF